MRRLRVLFGVLAAVVACSVHAAALPWRIPAGDFVTLCFHDVRVHVNAAGDQDQYAISTARLAQWFDWMREHGWHAVSVQQIVDAHNGGPPLPANAVLLSFDDGLESTYSQVYPLLQAYHYPALFALETDWLERVHGDDDAVVGTADELRAARSSNLRVAGKVHYGNAERGAAGFVSWAQVRTMQASGLVEFATHTDHLHHGILANPQGNQEPAVVTRLYDAHTHRYETDAQYRQRIHDDLKRSMDIIAAHTGHRPRAVVWPYGAVTPEVAGIARSLGLTLSFSLSDGHVSSPVHLGQLGRLLISDDPKPADIVSQIADSVKPPRRIQRAVQVDLDDIYDPNPAQVNRNLSALLDRIRAMHVRTVYLQAFADPDGDGTASALYFPNRFLPMRADLFNRVAWQLQTRTDAVVYAWLPLLAFDLPNKHLQQALDVKVRGRNGSLRPSTHAYRRLSPFLPRSLHIVRGIYADLARDTSAIHGVLIHDDAYLAADEDASACEPQARWPGRAQPMRNCHLDARQKTDALIAFGDAAIAGMRPYLNTSNPFHVARNLYARVVMDPSAEARFAQALGPFLAHYDEVALMAMPYLDGTTMKPLPWLRALVKRVAAKPGALNKVVFELQARDWRGKGRWIGGATLRGWMRMLIRHGALNLGYYPDDFLHNHPAFAPTRAGISLNDFPHAVGAP